MDLLLLWLALLNLGISAGMQVVSTAILAIIVQGEATSELLGLLGVSSAILVIIAYIQKQFDEFVQRDVVNCIEYKFGKQWEPQSASSQILRWRFSGN